MWRADSTLRMLLRGHRASPASIARLVGPAVVAATSSRSSAGLFSKRLRGLGLARPVAATSLHACSLLTPSRRLMSSSSASSAAVPAGSPLALYQEAVKEGRLKENPAQLHAMVGFFFFRVTLRSGGTFEPFAIAKLFCS